MKPFLFLLFLLVSGICEAQEIPEKFQPGIISNGGEFGLTISPDSKSALWVRSNGKRDTLVIMESVFKNGKWQEARIASFSTARAEWKDIDPIFSPDGRTLLFQSNRPVPGLPGRTGFDIWAVKKQGSGWGEAYHLGNTINTDSSESYASMSANGNLYFMKNDEQGVGSSDIYVSEYKDGKYLTPRNIGSPVNTSERESNPYISPGEDFLIYFSSDSAGFGEVDLYISFRSADGWGKPINIGAPVNTRDAEFCPFYHSGEKRLYFSRQVKAEGRLLEDLYTVAFDPMLYRKAAQEVKRKPFVLGYTEEFYSEELKENRVLNIYLPEGYREGDTTRYPVIYLLDGAADEDFIHIAGLVQFYNFPWINRVPKSIVVGIANVDRQRDFTFPTTIEMDKKQWPNTGGAGSFIRFMEKELQPLVEKRYRTAGGKTLIGQSLGGLLATQVLFEKPAMFDRYIIVSPSLWWDNGSMLKRRMNLPGRTEIPPVQVYVGVGKEGLTPGKQPRVMEDDARSLAEKLKGIGHPALKVFFDYLPAEDHASISHQAVSNAFRLLHPLIPSRPL